MRALTLFCQHYEFACVLVVVTLSNISVYHGIPVCVLLSLNYLLLSCTPRFVWTAITNQPIGTARRRARVPGAKLARAASHTPGNQSTGTHGVNIRAS